MPTIQGAWQASLGRHRSAGYDIADLLPIVLQMDGGRDGIGLHGLELVRTVTTPAVTHFKFTKP